MDGLIHCVNHVRYRLTIMDGLIRYTVLIM